MYYLDMALRARYTKFLNDGHRHIFLEQASKLIQDKTLKIPQYARYVCDLQILHRSKEHENDKNAYYGFSPINFLCAVLKDGTVSKTLFEFNIVNHFLKEKDGDRAVEVVEVMLVDLVRSCESIASFDIDTIDAELKKIEDGFLKEQKEQEDHTKLEMKKGEKEDEH